MNKLFTKIATAFVGIAMAIGVGVAIGSNSDVRRTEAAASTATYTVASASSLTSSGNPTGSSHTFSTNGALNNGAIQLAGKTAQKNFTLTLTGYAGYKITALSINAKSNKSSGNGALTLVAGSTTLADSDGYKNFSSSFWYGAWSQSKVTCDITLSNNNYTIKNNESVVLTITNNANSIYIYSVSFTYETGSSDPTKLETPTNVTYDSTNQRVKWNAVDHASSYKFSSDNGTSYTSTSTNLYASVSGLTTGTTYNCKVVAVGDGSSYTDSDAASFQFIKTEPPVYTSVTVTGGAQQGTEKGSAYIQCSASATGTNIPASPSFTWYVTENDTYGTTTSVTNKASIDNTGKVTFDDNCTVYVWALAPDGTTHNTSGYAVTASGITDPKGSKTNPYSVDEAFAAIAAGTGTTGVYATGIVSQIVTEYSSQYKNITFDISADGTTSGNQLRAYRCVTGDVTIDSSDDVMVGDIVMVGGDLTTYGDLKEFAQGCQLDSRTRKTISSLTITDNSGKTWFDGDTVQATDLQVVVNYSNDTHETITDGTGVAITSGATLSEGSNTVNVSFTNAYGTQKGSISISAAAVAVLDSVTITGTAHADKNGPWDLSNLTVTGTSQGGSAGDMGNITEDCELSTSASTTNPGNTTITVRVNYKSDTKIIDVENVDAVIRNIDKYTDTIDLAFTGQSGTSYGSWSGKQDQSDAIYAGNNAGGNSSVQLRSSNNSGVVSTGSGGDLISITINFDSNTVATRTVSIYGNTTPYSSAADLYSSSTSGTLIGEINIDNGASQTITVKSDESYQFVGIRSKSGAIYISSIEIVWGHEEQIKTLDSLSVTTNPTKSTYAAGETLNLTGLVVTAHYKEQGIDDAPTVAFTTSPEAGYVFTAEDGEAGYKVIDITSTENAEITTSFNVTVTPKKPTALNSTSAATWTDTQTLAGGAGRWKAVFTDSSEITNIKIGDANTVLKIGGVAVDTTLLAKTYAGQDATLEYTSQNTTVSNTFTIAVTNELSVDSFEDVPEYVLVTKSSDLIKANFTSLNGTPESYSVVSSNASKLSVSFDSALVDYDSSTKKGYLYFQVTAGNTQGQYTVTVSVTLGSRTESKSVSITVMGEAPTPSGVQYEQIASLDDLTSGKYVIAANVNGTYYALPSISSGKIEASTVTVSNGIITEEDAGVLPVDILKDGSGNIAIGKSGTYFSFPSSGTNFSVSSTATYYEVATNATGGTFKVATRGLVYRTGSTNQWGAYANSNIDGKEYFGFELFKEVSSSAEKTSFDWVKEFVDGYMYMDVISITDKGTGQCKGENGYYLTAKRAWNTMKTAYAEAGGLDDLVEVFENSFEDAHARYMSWASACGDSDPFNGTTIKTSTRIAMLNSVMNSNTTIIVIVTVGIAAIAIGGYFLLRKKKED